jgi:hypothetical protein
MHRLLWPMPCDKLDEETASRNVEFTALSSAWLPEWSASSSSLAR